MLEVCCGGYYDACQAYLGGARQIELNSALFLGGLTPSLASLTLTREHCPELKIIAMVRPRGGGFFYSKEDFRVMEEECTWLLKHGADGIAFGCLHQDATLNLEQNKRLLHIIHSLEKEAVFHRAYDCSRDPFTTMEKLIELHVDRVLTSGLKPTAIEGTSLLCSLQKDYGSHIQILPGSGINATNALKLMVDTGISQIHSSCKAWCTDPTTVVEEISYSYAPRPHETDYEVVSAEHVKKILGVIQ